MNEKIGKIAFWLWMGVFVLGAAAELLGLGWLTSLTDVKQLFLR
ncbi:MAG: hypothetical protein ACYS0E_10655 [Planctomycetota bacterium]